MLSSVFSAAAWWIWLSAPLPAAWAQTTPPRATSPTPSTAPSLPDPATVLRDPRQSASERDEAAKRLVLRQIPQSRQVLLSVLTDANNRAGQLAVARALPLDPRPEPAFIKPLFALVGVRQDLTESAIQALSLYVDQQDVHASLIQLALDDQQKDPTTRLSAVRALGAMSDKTAAQALMHLLTSATEPPSIRSAAGNALEQMTGAPPGRNDTARWRQWWDAHSAQSDADFARDMLQARSASLTRLQGRFGQMVDDSRRLLTEAYQLAPDKNKESLLLHYLRSAEPEIRALGAMLVQEDFKQARLPTPAVSAQLRNMVSDSSNEVRILTAQTLGMLNDAQALQALLAQLKREPDADVKVELIRAMVPMRNLEVVPVFLGLLHDPSREVVEAAARGLGDPDNLAPLIQKDPALAKHVADELRRTYQRRGAGGDESTIPLRVALIDAMGAMRQPELGQQLFSQLIRRSQPTAIRCAALAALGQLGKPNGDTWPANYITDELADPDDAVRLAAVKALMTTADINQAERLLDFVKRDSSEPDPQIRRAAWETLRAIFTDPQSKASNETLNRWADRFPVDQQPSRRAEILRVLAGRLEARNNASQLAAVRQNLGEALMSEHREALARGETDLARARAADAEKQFALALAYYREKYPTDQNMTTSALVEQRMSAQLASEQYDKACQFAAESIAANNGNQERLGPMLRNEVDRLGQANRVQDAMRLVDQINRMNPPLAEPYASQLKQLEQALRARTSKPATQAGHAPTTVR